MVGIILASHGNLAKGIFDSSKMIFGRQKNVQTVTLLSNEGPKDVKSKFEKAISSFDNKKEVLILIDLWGGTPFNQANSLFAKHKESWAIVTGMNLPMVIEAYGSRLSMNSAQKIAEHILQAGKNGIKIKPENSYSKGKNKKESSKIRRISKNSKNKEIIPKGTVIGDGKIKYTLVRVDSRLLHGQVSTSWTRATNPTRIIVVSDSVARNNLRKSMIADAAPPGVPANVIPVNKMIKVTKDPRFGNTKALILFENPEEAFRAIKGGMQVKDLNIGSMSYSPGKISVNNSLAIGKEDIKTFDELKKMGIKFDVRKVPSDSRGNMDGLIKKARKGLSKVSS